MQWRKSWKVKRESSSVSSNEANGEITWAVLVLPPVHVHAHATIIISHEG